MSVERVDIDVAGSPWHEEHLSRYYFIKDRVKDKVILDIACGTGFGTELLINNNASFVYAADVADEAIEICNARLKKINAGNFICHKQDGTQMSYADHTFDMVVSFETIEHIKEYNSFLKEISRVLKPGGLLVLSTPNALVTKPINGVPQNPFHVHEFGPNELNQLLSKFFKIELAAGQHVISKYGVVPYLPSFNRDALTFKQNINFLYWRFALRLPTFISNLTHKIFFSYPFYPAVDQYTFLTGNINTAHVQYYICKKTG
ncbi:MAG: class I SAM-dependent methyltransferase [Mucilaginibacter sp.]